MNPALLTQMAPVIPLIGALLILLTRGRPALRNRIAVAAGVFLFACLFLLWLDFEPGEQPRIILFEMLPSIPLALQIEPLGLLFALTAAFLWPVTTFYAIGYLQAQNDPHQTRFHTFFAIAIACAMGVAFAANLLTLFLFYELLTLSTWPLVVHSGSPQAKRSGTIYLATLLGTSILFFLLGIALVWAESGTLDFRRGGILPATAATPLSILLLLFLFGIGKAAIMPFHRWLPAAMVAPAPVSALLHAVAVVKAGVFSILKIGVYIIGTERIAFDGTNNLLIWIPAVTILLASLIALRQDNLKARLAYSTISQLSYIVLGALLASRPGIIGGGLHITMHAFGKITLFFCAGAIMLTAGRSRVSELNGLGRSMPLTFSAFLIGALAISGLPPTGGFWSKWHLGLGTLDAEMWVLLAVLMISSLLSFGYLVSIPFRAFFLPPAVNAPGKEAAPLLVAAPLLTAAGCLLLFFYPDPVFELVREIVP
ncbi:MAG: proton-conducting transporter membrane subunit [Pseudomonadota bacterium]|nr:proton-conducting transporter membrane subunit [Pseudomonadota bacterium]